MEYASFVQNLDKVSPNRDRCPPESPYSREFERRMGALVLNFDLDCNATRTSEIATENDGFCSEENDGDSGVGSFDEDRDDREATGEANEAEPKPVVAPYRANCLFDLEGNPAENRANARSNNSDLAHSHKRTHEGSDGREEDMNSKDELMAKLRKRSSSPTTTTLFTEQFKISQWSDSE